MNCFGLTDPGKTRTENQDSFLIENCEKASCVILALCDGMGGANAGGLASQLSCKAFVNYVYNHLTNYSNRPSDYPRIMREACEEANGVAFAYSQFGDNLTGMGTTMVAAIMRRNGSAGIITPDQAVHHPQKNVITRALGSESLVEADIFPVSLTPGDSLLLCSDGLSNIVPEEEITAVLVDSADAESACRDLLDLALSRGAPDNVSMIVWKR